MLGKGVQCHLFVTFGKRPAWKETHVPRIAVLNPLSRERYSIAVCGNALQKPRDRLLRLRVIDARISADQPQRRRLVEQFESSIWLRCSLSGRSEEVIYRNP
jgi:hypothetical protein